LWWALEGAAELGVGASPALGVEETSVLMVVPLAGASAVTEEGATSDMVDG